MCKYNPEFFLLIKILGDYNQDLKYFLLLAGLSDDVDMGTAVLGLLVSLPWLWACFS